MLQDVLKSWQEYRDEERRLSKWLSEKESQIEDIKHIDLGDADVVKKALKMFMVRVLYHSFEAFDFVVQYAFSRSLSPILLAGKSNLKCSKCSNVVVYSGQYAQLHLASSRACHLNRQIYQLNIN